MPVNTTYPGVYIDEVKSAVRTITGVPTAVAAFVGYAPRGPVDRPVHITGWADYENVFGGLHSDSPLSYAVYQFYMNGGSEAEIVRVVGTTECVVLPIGGSRGADGSAPAPAHALASESESAEGAAENPVSPSRSGRADGPALLAASPGSWARNLRSRVDYDTSEGLKQEPEERKLYNLTIRDTGTGAEERYLNVSIEKDSPRKLEHLLATSQLVKPVPGHPIDELPLKNDPVAPGADPLADPEKPEKAKEYFRTPSPGGSHDDAMPTRNSYLNGENDKTGLFHLLKTEIFNLLCLPGCHRHLAGQGEVKELLERALKLCVDRRAILLVDPPTDWTNESGGASLSLDVFANFANNGHPSLPGGESTKNAALYFPRIVAPDPLRGGVLMPFPPCGLMAGVLARTDVQRGVWKAAAGTDASLNGVSELEVPLTDLENGRLNPLGINCLRRLPAVGPVAWGARTMRGADRLADEWKYLPVRRLALFVEESLFRGTQWVVFEPNDEPLWASIRLNVGGFMNSLFRAGAFQGRTPQEAYLVKCDRENNPQNDIDRGIVNVQVGFAPLKPAEFVIVHIQQLAGQIQV
ncbi:phage tail sheath C-terminal domain-containing protein [Streptomyces sp. NPDC048641]|uniref:phage tail sheath C-terminal domain-containing protein n=1 Tax=Streptomyces sp. NPDC048641 TaxID=3154825 RepID=UPI003424B785